MADTPTPGPGELLARCRANAVKAKRGQEQTYRCPACQDLGWIQTRGVTYAGRKDSTLEQPCSGPTGTGCAYQAWRDEQRTKARPQVVEQRGRMD